MEWGMRNEEQTFRRDRRCSSFVMLCKGLTALGGPLTFYLFVSCLFGRARGHRPYTSRLLWLNLHLVSCILYLWASTGASPLHTLRAFCG